MNLEQLSEFKIGDKVVWVYDKNPHPDFGKTFTVKEYHNNKTFHIGTVRVEENAKLYAAKYFILESVYKSKLFKALK